MSKKTIIIIISAIFLIIVLGIGFYFYSNISNNPSPSTNSSGFQVGRPTGNTNSNNNKTGSSTEEEGSPTLVSRLQQISKDPVSGSVITNSTSSVSTIFTDRATGHSWQTDLDTVSLNKFTNTTIPKVYEATWSSKADFTILRYLNDDTNNIIESFIGKVSSSSLLGKFLPEDVTQLAISPSGTKIFYLYDSANGSVGLIADPNLATKKQIIASPAREWIVTWPKEDTLTFTTKASATADGYMFTLNATTDSFDKILGGLAGLTTLTNGDLTKTIYSESSGSSIRLYTYTHKNGEVKSIPLATLPEKCVWSKINNNNIYCGVPTNLSAFAYPDVWYQGLVSFNDGIWLIKTDTGETTLIDNLSTSFTGIDAVNLQLDKNEEYLTFMNKKDMQLWSLKIK